MMISIGNKKGGTTIKTIGYIRVSTEGQAKDGVSLENQYKRIAAYCEYKDFELEDVIQDAGVSGGINKARAGFIDLLNRIEAGGVKAVILYSLERLSRDMLTLLALERLLEEQGVELHTIEGQIDTSSPDGFMSFAMRAFMGEMERRQVKHRTKKAMEFKKSNGQVVGSIPYGYRREGKDLMPDLNEQATTKTICQLYEKGTKLSGIVRTLNGQGQKTRTGKPWTPTQVKRIIPEYRGSFKKSKTKVGVATRQFIEAIG